MVLKGLTHLWFKFADFKSEVYRCCCSGDWFSPGGYAPFHSVAISSAVRVFFFTQEVNTVKPAQVSLPGLQNRRSERTAQHGLFQ